MFCEGAFVIVPSLRSSWRLNLILFLILPLSVFFFVRKVTLAQVVASDCRVGPTGGLFDLVGRR